MVRTGLLEESRHHAVVGGERMAIGREIQPLEHHSKQHFVAADPRKWVHDFDRALDVVVSSHAVAGVSSWGEFGMERCHKVGLKKFLVLPLGEGKIVGTLDCMLDKKESSGKENWTEWVQILQRNL